MLFFGGQRRKTHLFSSSLPLPHPPLLSLELQEDKTLAFAYPFFSLFEGEIKKTSLSEKMRSLTCFLSEETGVPYA